MRLHYVNTMKCYVEIFTEGLTGMEPKREVLVEGMRKRRIMGWMDGWTDG